jgi:hypothetical protein
LKVAGRVILGYGMVWLILLGFTFYSTHQLNHSLSIQQKTMNSVQSAVDVIYAEKKVDEDFRRISQALMVPLKLGYILESENMQKSYIDLMGSLAKVRKLYPTNKLDGLIQSMNRLFEFKRQELTSLSTSREIIDKRLPTVVAALTSLEKLSKTEPMNNGVQEQIELHKEKRTQLLNDVSYLVRLADKNRENSLKVIEYEIFPQIDSIQSHLTDLSRKKRDGVVLEIQKTKDFTSEAQVNLSLYEKNARIFSYVTGVLTLVLVMSLLRFLTILRRNDSDLIENQKHQ